MPVLTDAQWAKFEAAIAAVNIRGARPRVDDRRTIEAIIRRIDNGAKWRSIPAALGNWHHAYLRFRRWAVRGVWDKIMAQVVAQGEPQLAFACVGGTIARASEGLWRATRQRPQLSLRFIRGLGHRGEALGRSRGGLGTKIVGVCDAAGRLVDFLLLPGQAHELAPSLTLMRRLPEAPSWALADMACDAHEFRSECLT